MVCADGDRARSGARLSRCADLGAAVAAVAWPAVRLRAAAAVGGACWCGALPGCCCWSATALVNDMLAGLGVPRQKLLFNSAGVLIGMTHLLLPYAVLPIYAALVRIDPVLLRASEGLGASRATTFRRILLPLSMSGVATRGDFPVPAGAGFLHHAGAARRLRRYHAVDADRRVRRGAAGLAAGCRRVVHSAGGHARGAGAGGALRQADGAGRVAMMARRFLCCHR